MTDRQIIKWIVLTHEGTAFTDHKHDRGGATHFGITWRLFNAYMGREMPLQALKDLTLDLAVDILHSEFCFKPHLHLIHDPRVKLCAVDFAIHSGPAQAVRSVQYAVFPRPPYDGVLGPKTQAATNAADPAEVHRAMLAYRLRFLGKVVAKYPEQAQWGGWWNRLANLVELPATL